MFALFLCLGYDIRRVRRSSRLLFRPRNKSEEEQTDREDCQADQGNVPWDGVPLIQTKCDCEVRRIKQRGHEAVVQHVNDDTAED